MNAKFLYVMALALAPQFCSAQQLLPDAHSGEPSSAATASVVTPSTTAAVTTHSWQSSLDRWLDLKTFNYGARYRSTFDRDNAHTFNQGEQRLIADGRFKFDDEGRSGVGFHLSSGRYFNWAYADFIGGGQHTFIKNVEAKGSPTLVYLLEDTTPFPKGFFNSGGGQLYLRQLFLFATPVKGVEFQYGGLAINHGVNTEATGYDDDGYMTGERVTIQPPKQAWLSEVSFTKGYLGALYTPNFFARGDTLTKNNYTQVLGRKNFGKRTAISADYTWTRPDLAFYVLKTTREAVSVNTHESRVFDQVLFEAYQRINGGVLAAPAADPFPDGKGYALTLTRSYKKRVRVEAGLANIDENYWVYLGPNTQAIILSLNVNGDQYGVGKRYFVRPTINLSKGVSLVANFSHSYDLNELSPVLDVWNAQALTAGVVFDLKQMIFPHAQVR